MTTETIESLRAEVERLEEEVRVTKEVEFPRRVEKVAAGWRTKLATLEANNARLREALENMILATKHLNPCPGTVEMCLEALNATPASTEWLDKLVMERLGKPFAWHHDEEGLSYENHYTGNVPLYRLTSGKEGNSDDK